MEDNKEFFIEEVYIPKVSEIKNNFEDLIVPLNIIYNNERRILSFINSTNKSFLNYVKEEKAFKERLSLFFEENDNLSKTLEKGILELNNLLNKHIEDTKSNINDINVLLKNMTTTDKNINSLTTEIKTIRNTFLYFPKFFKKKLGIIILSISLLVLYPMLSNFIYNTIDGIYKNYFGKTILESFFTPVPKINQK